MRTKHICLMAAILIASAVSGFGQMTSNYNSYDNVTMNFDSNGNFLSATVTSTLEGNTLWNGYPPCHHTGTAVVDFGGVYSSTSVGPVWPNYYMDKSAYVTLPATADCFTGGTGGGCYISGDYVLVDCECDGTFYNQDGGHSGKKIPKVDISVMLSTGDKVAGSFAAEQYTAYTHTDALGPRAGTYSLNNNPGCSVGTELVGVVSPTTYAGHITLHREVTSQGCYKGSNIDQCGTGVGDDTGIWLDVDPQQSNPVGKVYNSDAPGIAWSGSGNVSIPVRVRFNFQAWAIDDTGTAISPKINFYIRTSCTQDSTGAHLATDVSGDNKGAIGTTPTTWNLQ